MKPIKLALTVTLLFFALIGGFVYSTWSWANENFQSVNSTKPTEVFIESGSNTKQIASLLKANNIIKSSLLFRIYIRFLAVDQNLKPGQYAFTGKENLAEVVQHLLKGNIKTVSVTIPEGTTIKEVAAILQDAQICSAIDFLDSIQNPSLLGKIFSDWELIPEPEGMAFPDTYFFTKGTPGKQVAERMVKLARHQIDKFFQKIDLPKGFTQYQACIMASIVEKEAILDRERPLVASVFLNRLKKNMKLESDAIVMYGLPERKKRMLYGDLKIDTPYNSYMHMGLPPTPISNFGVASMKAVVNPEKTDYLFFVATGKDGSHVFSKTLNEHSKNAKEYHKLLKQKK